MVAYLIEISNPKYPFFSTLTKFQKCMFKKIHQIYVSPNSPTRATESENLHIEINCALIEYENRKATLAHYPVQLINLEYANGQR